MKRTVLAVLVAAVLAFVGCAAVLLYVRGADARAVAGKKAVRVLVATKLIPQGTPSAEVKSGGYVEQVVMPKESVPSDALGTIDSNLDNLVVNTDIQARQLLLRGAFELPDNTSGGMRIAEGKVAVSFPINSNAGPMLLQPGSKIAIYDTFTVAANGQASAPAGATDGAGANQATRLLLKKVEVIAVAAPGQAAATKNAGKSSTSDQAKQALGVDPEKQSDTSTASMTLVTVAVTQAEAERLIHVAQTGTMWIALLDDSTTLQDSPGVDNTTLFN